MEIQEPTDYTLRVEKTTPLGNVVPDFLIHQGLGEAEMLNCFHYEPLTREEAEKHWRLTPKITKQEGKSELISIIDNNITSCFSMWQLKLNGKFHMKKRDHFISLS